MRRSGSLIFLLLLIAALAAYAGRPIWLPLLGEFLVVSQTPEPAGIVVVLAGDYLGERVLRAVELVEQGHAPRVLVDSARFLFGVSEGEQAIQYAMRQGAPPGILELFPIDADSTFEEALLVDAKLVRRGIPTALLVTSNFHTRRALKTFRRLSSGRVKYVMIAAPSADFQPDRWWYTRSGKRTLLLEYLKTVNSWYELAFAP